MNERPFLLSIYDESGEWAKPYINAGWRVLLWDAKYEGCILRWYGTLMHLLEDEGIKSIDGLLAAPPCSDFSGSGARWWKEKDVGQRWWPDEDPAMKADVYFKNTTERSVYLVEIVQVIIDMYKPRLFWALENPVGRLEKLCPWLSAYRRLLFDPCDFGDPYTKKTVLYGEFNANLIKTPTEPVQGSKMWNLPPSKNRKKIRSKTPPGFANAFFQANGAGYYIAGKYPGGATSYDYKQFKSITT